MTAPQTSGNPVSPAARPTVAIVGGGFSGAAVAFHLARAGTPAQIIVFEPRDLIGGGLAYSGADPVLRVNVPATRMSLLPEDEGHFSRWLAASGALGDDAQAFAGAEAYPRRREFGRYVTETLKPLLAAGAIRHVRDKVVSMRKGPAGWRLVTSAGEAHFADLGVIATTHPAPSLPPQFAEISGDVRLIADPLADDAVKNIKTDERVLIVGAGLTAADLVAALDARAHRGPITLVSRRGLRARGRSLAAFAPEGDFLHPPSLTATVLLRRIRAAIRAAEASGRNWQAVIEGVRNQGQDIWRALRPDARRRVVRHLRAFWDVHRFRAAPQIEAILDAKLKNRTLELKRARLGAVTRDASGLTVPLRDLRAGVSEKRVFDRIIVATGPTHRDILKTQPYFAELAEAGALTLDDTELGVRTSLAGRAIGADGIADPSLFVAGPLARGTFGELMGLPQVSIYAKFVAAEVAAALKRAEQRAREAA